MHISKPAYTVWNVTIPKEDRILPKFIWLRNLFYMKQLEELVFHRTHFTKNIQMKIPSGFPLPRTSQRRCCQCLSQGMKSKLPRLTSKSPQQSVLNLSFYHFLKLLSLNLISATYQPQSLGKNAYKMKIVSSLVKWKLHHLSCKPQWSYEKQWNSILQVLLKTLMDATLRD